MRCRSTTWLANWVARLLEGDAAPIRKPGKRGQSRPAVVTAAGTAVRQVREAAGMTQQELGEAIGSTQAAIARIEGGRVQPNTVTLEKIGKVTGRRLTIEFEPVPEGW